MRAKKELSLQISNSGRMPKCHPGVINKEKGNETILLRSITARVVTIPFQNSIL